MNNFNRNTDVEWEALISNLSKNNKQNGAAMKAGNIFSGLVSLSTISGISAIGIMLVNMVINKAWPAIEAFTPAIGYFHAFFISVIVWVIWLIKSSIQAGITHHKEKQQ
tara:strand:- start:3163 stop:3489 length:327 start_codon:yes stop_codon:yes gene_type:complete